MAADLFIRVAPSDTGTRPFNACADFWTNESIWLDPPNPDQTTAQENQASTIKVRVRNKGTASIQFVKVRAYLLSPLVGLVRPGQALINFVSIPLTVPPIGTAPDGVVFDCGPWTPTSSQISQTTDGHLCLAANCFQDPNLADLPPFDGHDLQSTENFDMCNDAHQGQRNIHVVAFTQQKLGEPINFGFLVASPDPEHPQDSTVEILKLPSKRALHQSELLVLHSNPAIKIARSETGRRHLLLVDDAGREIVMGFSRRKPIFHLDAPGLERRPHVRLAAFSEDTHPMSMKLQLSPKEKVGSMHAFDIVQRTPKGEILGGIRVITVVTP